MNRTLSLLSAVASPVLLGSTACATRTTSSAAGSHAVHSIRLEFNNAHAVRFPEGVLLIDAGLERDAPDLVKALQRSGIGVDEIKLVVVTHGHADHAGGAGWLHTEHGIPVMAGAGDQPLLGGGHNDTLCPTDRMAEKLHEESQGETYTPFTPEHLVSAPVDLSSLGLGGTVRPVTGHTAGSLVVTLDDAVFAGDLLRGSIVGHKATAHFFQCNPQQSVDDVRAVLAESDASTWYLGHFGPVRAKKVRAFAGVAD